ncbi:uncharacterized protein LOC135497133 [Lineus longissimus]|uniref:uncharacterized protein LOC135497133 n=1 Tax=Lineus longissimus TaxID=88925 RepID=UPI002B4DF060
MGQSRRRNTDGPKKLPPKVEKGKVIDEDQKKSEVVESGQGGRVSSLKANGRPQVLDMNMRSTYHPTLFNRCKTFFKYFLLIILIPPFLNYASLQREATHLKPKVGELYDIGWGQRLFLSCIGKGAPTVILDAPTGMSSDVWFLVQQKVAKYTKVCIYDRGGLGFSDRPVYVRSNTTEPTEEEKEDDPTEEESFFSRKSSGSRWAEFTVERMADDLSKLITVSSEQPKPFILVGSEMGALVARFYTQLYESDVSDVILVDPLVENLFTHDSGVWSQFWFGHLLPSFQSLQLAAATGLTRIALLFHLIEQPITGNLVPEEVITRQKHLLCHPRHLSSVVDEHHFINDSFAQISLLYNMKSFPSNVSVTVITGNYYDEQLPSALNKAWAKSNQHLISTLHPQSKYIVVNGGDHRMLYRMPDAISDPIIRTVKQYKASKAKTKPQEK